MPLLFTEYIMRKHFKKVFILTFLIGTLAFGAIVSWRIYLVKSYSEKIYTNSSQLPSKKVAIILGAAALNNRPSDVLKERLLAGIKLYKEGKVEKLLMSGDNRVSHYSEPEVMQKYAEAKGVPAADIQPDYAGRRTYDTCYRAKQVFQLEDAIVVTNGYHLPRTLYLCESAGLKVVGYNADIWKYPASTKRWWQIRETLATSAAWYDLHFRHPTPILGANIDL